MNSFDFNKMYFKNAYIMWVQIIKLWKKTSVFIMYIVLN